MFEELDDVEQALLDDGTHDAAGIQVLSAAEVAPRGYYRLSVVKCTPPVYRTPFARGGSMYPLEVYPLEAEARLPSWPPSLC